MALNVLWLILANGVNKESFSDSLHVGFGKVVSNVSPTAGR